MSLSLVVAVDMAMKHSFVEIFEKMLDSEDNVQQIIENEGLKQISDSGELEKIIDKIISDNQDQVDRYKNGESKLIGFFVGQTMKASQGKADPKLANELIRKKLS